MAGLDANIYGNVEQPKQTSLADMVNLARGIQQLQVERATAPARIEQQNIATNTAKLENLYKHQAQSTRDLLKLLNSPNPITPDMIQEHVIKTMNNAGAPESAIKAAVMDLPKQGTDKELRAFVARHATNSLSAEAQLEKLFPQTQFINTGREIKPVSGGGALAYQPAGSQAGPSTATELPPTVEAVTPTGEKYLLGGPRGPVQTSLSPTTETQYKELGNIYSNAKPALENIATNKTVNNKVLQLLSSTKVDTGPVVAKIKDATANISLNTQQQELLKYLEQRIQGASSQDERNSMRSALGSIGTDKNALKNIIKGDNAELRYNELKNRSIIKAGGIDTTRPDLKRIGEVNTDWASIKDPQIIRFYEAVGKDINNPNDKEDAAYFLAPNGYLSKLSADDKAEFLKGYRKLKELMSK